MFESYRSYEVFANSVLREYRYISSKETQTFLENLYSSSSDKVMQIDPGFKLFRAQKGCTLEEADDQIFTLPYKSDRMLPDATKVGNGRVNSKGIPSLYVSDDEDTAVAETRPWIKQEVSVAMLRLKTPLRILDLSNIEKVRNFFFEEPKDLETISRCVWADVSYAFSRPVNHEDQDLDYIPTQIIGEFFKQQGFDGIKYRSLLATGNNYAIFDTRCVEFVAGVVVEIGSISVQTERAGNIVQYSENGTEMQFNYVTDFRSIEEHK